MTVSEVFGRRMRQARLDAGETQAWLGEKLGWFPQAVSEAEKGRRNFTAEEIFAIGHLLGHEPSWFFPTAGLEVRSSETGEELIRDLRRITQGLAHCLDVAS